MTAIIVALWLSVWGWAVTAPPSDTQMIQPNMKWAVPDARLCSAKGENGDLVFWSCK